MTHRIFNIIQILNQNSINFPPPGKYIRLKEWCLIVLEINILSLKWTFRLSGNKHRVAALT